MEDDRIKWNDRYRRDSFFIGPHPSSFLVDQIELIESLLQGREALDIACGEGRNSTFLAEHGFHVTGVDISEEGIAKAKKCAAGKGLEITFLQADLEEYRFSGCFDLIINFNFLLRSLIPEMVTALKPAGLIVFDTILDAPSLAGNHNKAFLLQPGELATIFRCFGGEIILSDELCDGPVPTARLIFQKNG